ncbi:MAG TPA: glycosyltransferase family 2 protein [Roseiarcus sp.]|nr:glycosyltransferase family 2 protein [Roseiarcus sp.]
MAELDQLSSLLFWVAFGLIVYHHIGYPFAIRLCLVLWPPRSEKTDAKHGGVGDLPSIAIIVPAHNEAAVIEAKIRNLAALDYPADRLKCIVALDGCTDATRSVAEAAIKTLRPGLITLVEYQPNVGKVAVLNDQIAKTGSEIVALTDASALVGSDTLIRAAEHFRDPIVGVVTGTYSMALSGSEGETAYWRYQSDVRFKESVLAGPMGAHGAFYLFRRAAWTRLPEDTINDDFVLPMTIVAQGFRAVLEPAITALELERTKSGQDFWRRVRIGAGNLQQAIRLARLGDPRRGWVSFAFLSGKGLRGVLPVLLIVIVLTSLWRTLQGNRAFGLIFALEILIVGSALLSSAVPMRNNRWFSAPMYVLEGYVAITLGALLLLLGQDRKVWRLSKAFNRNRVA